MEAAKQNLAEKRFIVDYVAIADARDLSLRDTWDGTSPLVCLIAAFLEGVRLIDNMVITNNGMYEDKNIRS
jgi:pantothenate synthetase